MKPIVQRVAQTESARSVEDFINKIKAGGPEKPQEISKQRLCQYLQ